MINLLSLTGGGFKGAFTIEILSQLELLTEHRNLNNCVDIYAGTSAGSIIAAAMACGYSVDEIDQIFFSSRTAIFHNRTTRNRGPGTLKSRYDNKNLRATLESVFEDRKLCSTRKPLIIPTVDIETFQPIVFASFPIGSSSSSLHYDEMPLVDAILASCSAPTFFPIQRFSFEPDLEANPKSNGWFGDGGLVANAPDLIAATEAAVQLGLTIDDIRILSIGTTHSTRQVHRSWFDRRFRSKKKRWGIMDWLIWRRAYLIDLFMNSQVKLAEMLMSKIIGKDRYIRIDQELAHDSAFELDDIDSYVQITQFAQQVFNQFWEDDAYDPYRISLYLDHVSE